MTEIDDQDIELMEAQFTREARDELIKFRVNQMEKEEIEELARILNAKVSVLMRYLVKKANVVIKSRKDNPGRVTNATVTFDDL